MKWFENYDAFLELFEKHELPIDETVFHFRSTESMGSHWIGYLPEFKKPYWAGYCDVPDGCEFNSAEELFEAKIYDGRSIHDRWEEIVIDEIGMIPADKYLEYYDK